MAERGTLTVRRAPDDKLREHAEHRHKAMLPDEDRIAEAYVIAGLCMPSRSKTLVECQKRKNRSASRKATVYDGYGIRSFEVCANGMLSGLSSRSRPWRRSVLEDESLSEFHDVRVWLDGLDNMVYSAFAASNFYEAMLSCYLELAGFGTAAVVMVNHPKASPKLVSHALTFGEYGVATGDDGRPDSLSRSYTLTVRQVVAAYAADRFDRRTVHWDRVSRQVRDAWDKSNYERLVEVRQLIEPNAAYVPGKLGVIGKPWRSIKWDANDERKTVFLAVEGYSSQPFAAPRWETLAGEVWGTGRGKKALADLRGLQMQAKRKGEATDMIVKPPTWGPPSVGRIGMLPGQHTTVAAADMNSGIKPVYQVPYQTIGVIREDVQDAREAIDRMTFADLFLAITNMPGVQPRNVEELARRYEEQLTQLGPVTDRANNELLQVMSDRVVDILIQRGDVVNNLPPPPEELQDEEIATDFTSVLTQAQRMLGIGQTERAVSFVGNMAAVFPDAIDNIDPDAVVSDYWTRAGAAPAGLRDPKVRDQLRAQRAQQAQMEQMAGAMPAVKDGADAAALLAEADIGGMAASGYL